ncbi:efflux transporter outer membrane subunit [Rubripirellula amarantea]|nr:efflux transporter outer membrane subunit [Rubripirellula amarantea]
MNGLAILALVTTASGCMTTPREWAANCFKVGPNYFRPAAPVESQWIDFKSDARISDAPADASAWWTVFNDPQLNGLVAAATRQNLTLRIAGTRIQQAQAIRGIAVGSLFPQVQQSFGSYDRVQISKNIANSAPVTNFDQWAAGFNLSWEIDFWGRFRRGIESADAALDSTVEGYDNVLVLLLADVATTYVQIRTLQAELRLLSENVASQKQSLSIAEAQYRAGQANAADVLQTRNNVEQTESLIPPLEAVLRQQNNALCVLLGLPPRDLVAELGEGPIPTAPTGVAIGIPAELLRRRPDVRQAERIAAAQCAQIGIAEAEFYPHIAINGVIQWQAQDLDDLFTSPSTAGSVGPSFGWNILNYGRIRNSVRQEQALFDQAVLNYQDTVLKAQRETEDSLVGFLKAQEQTEKLQLAVRDINELSDILLTQATSGATNFDRLFVVQAQATVQQDNLATSQGNIAINLIRLYRALGGGWQIRLDSGQPFAMQSAGPTPEVADPEIVQPPQVVPLPEVIPLPGETP